MQISFFSLLVVYFPAKRSFKKIYSNTPDLAKYYLLELLTAAGMSGSLQLELNCAKVELQKSQSQCNRY